VLVSDDEDKQEVNVDLRSAEEAPGGGEQTGPETENGMDTNVQGSNMEERQATDFERVSDSDCEGSPKPTSRIGEEEKIDDDAAGSEGEGGEQEPARQDEATAVMINKALKKVRKRIIVQADASEFLQEISKNFLGELLNRPPLSGSMDQNNVKKAINEWIPPQGVGNKMRFLFSTQPPNDFGCCSAIKLKHKK
jgi:hypothetical protein